jgi:ABC-type transport system involved in multi-copper enzyme maturation permease subunit
MNALPVLLGDIFDPFRLQLPDGIVNWLTPVWILCVGAAAGLVLCAALWGLLWLFSKIPGVGMLAESPGRRRAAITGLAIVFFLAALGGYFALRQAPAAQANAAAAAAAAAGQANPQPAEQPRAGMLDWLSGLAGTAALAWLLATAVVTLTSRRSLVETPIAIREGVLWPLFIMGLVMAGWAVFGLVVVRRPTELLESLVRWPGLAIQGNTVFRGEVAPSRNAFDDPPEVAIDVDFRKDEIRAFTVRSDQHVRVRTEPFHTNTDPSLLVTLDVPAGEERTWRREQTGVNPFKDRIVTKLYAKNLGNAPAKVEIYPIQQVANPEMLLVPMVAVSMAGVFLIYLLERAALPKLAAVSLSTAKSEIAQPLYAILVAAGIFLLIVFVFIPYNTFGDDIKQLKDSGLSLILVLCILQAVWAASTSVADEVEGKTALTVLSKPVSRRDFILGKFSGIAWSVGLMCVVFGLVLLITVAYKPIYDYREGGYEINHQQLNQDPTWHDCHREMVQVVPGLVLVYLETLVIGALSVAISTRLPSIANFIISFAVYVLGHLTPLLVQSQVVAEQLPPVVFFGRLIATVLPVLDHFNIQASVAAGVAVPLVYLAWSFLYCVLYSGVAMLLALTLFEDRDLA